MGEERSLLGEFKLLLDNYALVPEDERKLYAQRSSTVSEPMKRRELKIAQFKKEKEIKTKISVCIPSTILCILNADARLRP